MDRGSSRITTEMFITGGSKFQDSLDNQIRDKANSKTKVFNRIYVAVAVTVLSLSVSISGLLGLAYNLEHWEFIHYSEPLVKEVTEENENVTSVYSSRQYFTFTVHSDVLALPEHIHGGLWHSCSDLGVEIFDEVEKSGVQWLTDKCQHHSSLGLREIDYQSEEIIRHSLTRVGQSCIIVSTICLLASLGFGLTSIVLRNPLLSILAATLMFASGSYDFFTALLINVRAQEAKHLSYDQLPLHIGEASTITFGISWFANIAAIGLSCVAGFIWIVLANLALKEKDF